MNTVWELRWMRSATVYVSGGVHRRLPPDCYTLNVGFTSVTADQISSNLRTFPACHIRLPSILDFVRTPMYSGSKAPNMYFAGYVLKDSGEYWVRIHRGEHDSAL